MSRRALAAGLMAAVAMHAPLAHGAPPEVAEDETTAAAVPIDVAPIEVMAVDAPRTPVEAGADPTPARFVVRGEGLRQAGLEAPDVLAQAVGVQLTRRGGAADLATAAVRGATSAQTPIYLAGVRLNDDITGTVDVSSLPIWMLRRVEVYRGHAPLGSDRLGIGGAIRFEPQWPRRPTARAGFGIGSFGRREARAGVGVGSAEAGAWAGVRHVRGDGDFSFLDDGGTRFDTRDDVTRRRANADHETFDGWALGRVRGAWGSAQIALNTLQRDAGAPGLLRIGARMARSRLQRSLAAASAAFVCGDACLVRLQSSALSSRYRLDDPLRELSTQRRSETRGGRFVEGVVVEQRATAWLEVVAGVQAEQSVLDVVGGVDARRQLWRGQLSARAQPTDSVDVVLTGAVGCHTTRAGGPAEACGTWAPVVRAGVAWRPHEVVSLQANVAEQVRVPTLGELHGVSETTRGNPLLERERAIAADLGVSAQHAAEGWSLYAQLFGFARFAEDMILYRRTSLGAVTPYNAQAARVLGMELSAGGRLADALDASIGLAGLDGRDVSDGRSVVEDRLPLQAPWVISARVDLSLPEAWKPAALGHAGVGVQLRHRAARVADPAGLIVLPDQQIVDLQARVALRDDRLALRARVDNLLDQDRFDQVGYPLPGRTLHASVEAWW